MAKQNRNTRRMLVAWLLLVLFMLPMVVKAVHVCQVESELAVGHKTAGQHSQSHDTDTCKICHFAFFNYMKATSIQLNDVVIILLGFLFLACVTRYVRSEVEVISLRAPPTRF